MELRPVLSRLAGTLRKGFHVLRNERDSAFGLGTIKLRDGTKVRIRPVTKTDKDLLSKGFLQLSPESRFRRFLTTKQMLTDQELAYLTDVNNDSHYAIGAEIVDPEGNEEGIGVARYIRDNTDQDQAEVAVTVIDRYQHQGLGAALLLRLILSAHRAGIRCLYGHVRNDNGPVFRMFQRAQEEGIPLHFEKTDTDEIEFHLDIRDLVPILFLHTTGYLH